MKLQLLLALGFSFVLSCNKHSETDSPETGKLKKVLMNNMSFEYVYNKDGRVSRLTRSDSKHFEEVSYDEGLISRITYYSPDLNQKLINIGTRVFLYDASKRLTAIHSEQIQMANPGKEAIRRRFEYLYLGESKEFSSCIEYDRTEFGDIPRFRNNFKYDSRGNIVEHEYFSRSMDEWILNRRYLYEYEPVPNPLYITLVPVQFSFYTSKDLWVKYSEYDPNSLANAITVSRSYSMQNGKVIASKMSNSDEEVKYEYY